MNPILDLANAILPDIGSDPAAARLLLLGLAQLLLVGAMLMSDPAYTVQKLVVFAGIVIRKVWQLVISKIIEIIIICLLSLSGRLWLLDLIPEPYR